MPAAPSMPLLDPAGFAELAGVDARTVRKWIARGLPASKDGRFWRIEPEAGGAWVQSNIEDPPPIVLPLVEPHTNGAANGVDAGEPLDLTAVDRHVTRLSEVLTAFTAAVPTDGGKIDGGLIRSIKEVSGELRQWEAQRAEMRARAARLMDREDHVRILGTFARLVIDELNAWSRSTPDAVIDKLTEIGVRCKAKKTAKSLDLLLAERADELRTRIADAVASAGDLIE